MHRIGSLQDVLALTKGDSKIVVIGLGTNGKSTCEFFLDQGVKVKCFIDEAKDKVGKKYLDVPVLHPTDYKFEPDDLFIICILKFTDYTDEVILNKSIIKNLNVDDDKIFLLDRAILNKSLLLKYFRQENVDVDKDVLEFKGLRLPNYFMMSPNIAKAFIFEAGDLILPTYFNDWSSSVEGPYDDDKLVCEGTVGGGRCVVLDCGANIGIFSAIAASKGCKVYALEPVPESRKVLEKVVELYPNDIVICDCAVADFTGDIFITNTPDLESNKIAKQNDIDTIKTKCYTVDDFVRDNGIERVDFIKADIEGAERDMLRGANQTLKKFQPVLSLCTYHFDDDPEVLENIIIQTNPKYVVKQRTRKLFASV